VIIDCKRKNVVLLSSMKKTSGGRVVTRSADVFFMLFSNIGEKMGATPQSLDFYTKRVLVASLLGKIVSVASLPEK